MKNYLKGFANLGYLPLTTNTTSGYATAGDVAKLPGATSCAPTNNTSEYTIYADDTVYDSGSEWQSTTLVITVQELSLEALAALTGATLDDATDELSETIYDTAPEVALTFSALRRDGGYRLYRYYAAKLTNYSVSHNTRGESNESQSYELTFSCTPRKYDGAIRKTLDIAKGTPLSWLDSIPAEPTTELGG